MEVLHSTVVLDRPVHVAEERTDEVGAAPHALGACAASAIEALDRLGPEAAARILIVLDELMPTDPCPQVTIRFAGVEGDGQCTFEMTATDDTPAGSLRVRCTQAGWLCDLTGHVVWRD